MSMVGPGESNVFVNFDEVSKGHENRIPERTGAKEGLLLAFRRRYKVKRTPMTITIRVPPPTPPIVPPMIPILEFGDVDPGGSGVAVDCAKEGLGIRP